MSLNDGAISISPPTPTHAKMMEGEFCSGHPNVVDIDGSELGTPAPEPNGGQYLALAIRSWKSGDLEMKRELWREPLSEGSSP